MSFSFGQKTGGGSGGFGAGSGGSGGGSGGFAFGGGKSAGGGFSTPGKSGGGFGFGGGTQGTPGQTSAGRGITGGGGSSGGGGGFSFGGGTSGGSKPGGGGGGSGFSFGGGGQQQQQQQSGGGGFGGFGSGNTATSGGFGGFGGFGSSGRGFGGFGQQQAQQQQQQQQQAPPTGIHATFVQLSQSYETNQPSCRFNHMVYNKLEPGQVEIALQQLRSQFPQVPDYQWVQAMERNPDPIRMVPVPMRSSHDLVERLEQQKKRIEAHKTALAKIEELIEKTQQNHEAKTSINLESAKQRHMALSMRMLKLMKRLEVLRLRGVPTGSADIDLRNNLTALQRELHKPNQYRGRLNELLPQLSDQSFNMPLQEPINDEDLESVKRFLAQQHEGLSHLVGILQQDTKDVKYMHSRLREINSGKK